MIFYFSGTGNSLYAARRIAEHHGEELISIVDVMNDENSSYEYKLNDDEIIGFVYPVYAWAPPEIVLCFIERLKFQNYNGQYIFSVATCGDNTGNTMKVLEKSLSKICLPLHSGFSIIMPNNYIIMFNVDSKAVEKRKLDEAEERLAHINEVIKVRGKNVFELRKGLFPGVLTGVINPLFNKRGIDPGKFYADDNCNGCGICEKVCSLNNIKVLEKPKWGKHCTQCLACIHHCPVRAIQYGKKTREKGRYTNPNL